MTTPEFLATLEELPRITAELLDATLGAGRRLVRASVSAAAAAVPFYQLAIRRTQLELRFFLARRGAEVRFFFAKQPRIPRALAARLQFYLQAAPRPSPADKAAEPQQDAAGTATSQITSCRYRLLVPPFLIVGPTAAELLRYAPEGTTAENGVLLRLGSDGRHVLGIRNPEAEQDATAVYTSDLRQPLDRWPGAPFLELVETLRAWLADGMPAAAEVELTMPTDPSALSDVHATVYWIVQAYHSLEAAQLRAETTPLPPPLRSIMPRYEVTDYVADIGLGMERDGQFTTLLHTEPVALGLRLTVSRELGGPVASIQLMPPDFVIAGALHAAFAAQLRDGAPRNFWSAVGIHNTGEWTDFIDRAAARMVVFRTDRDSKNDLKIDTDIVVLCGLWRDAPRTLVLRTAAVVDMTAQPVGVKLTDVVLVYDSITPQRLDDRTLAYFMRFALSLQSWLSLWRPAAHERKLQ